MEIKFQDKLKYQQDAINSAVNLFKGHPSDKDLSPISLRTQGMVEKIDGKEETARSCDAMLYTPKTVCFIELKEDKKGNDWLNHGMEQLTNTINFFGNELDKYENKKAYLCNSRRPFIPSIHKIAQQQFMQKNKILLRIKTEIEELK